MAEALESANSRISELEAELAEISKERDGMLHHFMSDAKEQAKAATTKLMNAKTELQALIAELEPKAGQFDEVAAKLASAEAKLAEVIKNADETTAIAKDLTIENAALHADLEATKQKLCTAKQDDAAAAHAEIAELTTNVEMAEDRVLELEGELADAQEKLVHSELDAANVKAATDAALEDKVLELSEAEEHAKQVSEAAKLGREEREVEIAELRATIGVANEAVATLSSQLDAAVAATTDKASRVTMLEAKLKATQGKLTKSIANGASEMQRAKEDAKAKLDAFKKQYVHQIEEMKQLEVKHADDNKELHKALDELVSAGEHGTPLPAGPVETPVWKPTKTAVEKARAKAAQRQTANIGHKKRHPGRSISPTVPKAAKPKTTIKVGQLSAYIHAGKKPALGSGLTAAAAGDGACDIADGAGGEDDDDGAAAIEETVVKSGVLLKAGKSKFNLRYFELMSSGMLNYKKKETDVTFTGTIALSATVLVDIDPEDETAFFIQTDAKEHHIKADTSVEATDWADAIAEFTQFG